MNLYEINSQILDCIDPETGEVMDIDRLEKLNMAKPMLRPLKRRKRLLLTARQPQSARSAVSSTI